MSLGDFLTLATLALAVLARHAVPRPLHPPGHGGRADAPEPGPPPGRARRSTASAASTRRPSRRWKGYAVSRARRWPSSRSSRATSSCGSRTSCRSTRAAIAPMTPGAGVQHVGQLRDEHELAELLRRDRRQLPDPGGGARGAQLHLGRDRPADRHRPDPRPDPAQLEDARQLLGRPDPRRPLHPAADLDRRRAGPRLAGRPADVGCRPRPSRRSQGAQQTIAFGPIASQEWIKEMGNNGGGFLNANSAHPFENPTALTNWLEMFAHPDDAVRADLHVRPVRRQPAPGLDDLRRDGARSCSSASVVAMNHEYVGNPLFPAGVDQAGVGNMEGKEVRFGAARRRPVRGRHDRHEHGRDQRLARQLPADRRPRPAVQHGARRDHARAASAPACTACSSSARSSRCSSPA